MTTAKAVRIPYSLQYYRRGWQNRSGEAHFTRRTVRKLCCALACHAGAVATVRAATSLDLRPSAGRVSAPIADQLDEFRHQPELIGCGCGGLFRPADQVVNSLE